MIVRKLEALFTLNTNALQFKKAASELDKLASHAETVMKAIAGYWAVQALQNFVANTANAMSEIGKTAGYLGVTSDALQELRYAAEKSGVSIDALDDALKELQVRAVDAKAGEGEAAEAFTMLGLKSTDAAGRIREPLELLDAVADSLNAMPTQSDRIWIADAIFGDEGSMVLKMLKDGSLGLMAMRKEARALGITLGANSIEKASRFNQALKKLQNVSSSIGRIFVEKLLPPLSWILEKFGALSIAFNQLESRASLVRTSLLALGGILGVIAIKSAVAFGPMILFAGAIVAGISAAALIIDDLWTAFKGGNSVFLSLHRKARAFFEPLEQWILNIPKAFSEWLIKSITQGLDSILEQFIAFQNSVLSITEDIKQSIGRLFDGIMPDFLKKNFSTTIKQVSLPGNESNAQPFSSRMAPLPASRDSIAETIKQGIGRPFDDVTPDFLKNFSATIRQISSPGNESNAQPFNARMAPLPASVSNQNRFSSQQNISVSVNVKSQANPQEIGGEISKAVRKALERERFNAFMGVMNYAG